MVLILINVGTEFLKILKLFSSRVVYICTLSNFLNIGFVCVNSDGFDRTICQDKSLIAVSVDMPITMLYGEKILHTS